MPNTAHAMPPSFPARLGVVGDDRLIVHVSRGHHKHRRFRNAHLLEGAGEIVQQEELHRGGGEHNAQLGQLVGKAAASATP